MKQQYLAAVLILSLITAQGLAQNNSFEAVGLYDLSGQEITIGGLSFDDKLMIEFWAPGLPMSEVKINTIAEEYDQWVDQTGLKVILVTAFPPSRDIIQKARQFNWPFDIYFDPEHKFYQAISGLPTKTVTPKSYIINKALKIVDVHTGAELVKREEAVENYDQNWIGVPKEMRFPLNEYVCDLNHYYVLAEQSEDLDK